ncbi:MAG TPA: aspartate kinase [Candidatus Dormibacteraeota bacterium]|nr:aspartate kinase [Candidatus Dormibacteraeota bacterium]
MSLIVQKYGGTSVGSVERIQAVARRVGAGHRAGHQLVVVVSAMSGDTNKLLDLAQRCAPQPALREVDVLIATGEQVTSALLAIALQGQGVPARSFLGHQIRIDTDSAYGRARIQRIDDERLRGALGRGEVAVVAGFQGVDEHGHITTLGRGGSDTSAVAVAAALRADVCEIYTDVDGVYTTDPRICPQARKLHRISHDEMLELASLGAKVLQIRSVEFAKRYGVPLCVRSSFDDSEGTWVVPEDRVMEQVLVSGVSLDRDQAKITLRHVPDKPGLASKVLGPMAAANISVDMIIQNASTAGDADLTFTLPKSDVGRALPMVEETAREIGAQVSSDTEVVKVSVVGLGMRSHAGVAARMFEILAAEGINIQMISTSEIKISVVIEAKYGELAVRALHKALIEEAVPEA